MKVKQAWKDRRAQMSPQRSKIELALLGKLQQSKIRPISLDRKFCLRSTTPDFYFPQQNLAVYIDGPMHLKRQDRDEQLRALLTKYHGIRVLAIPYKRYSPKEAERIFNVIKASLSGT